MTEMDTMLAKERKKEEEEEEEEEEESQFDIQKERMKEKLKVCYLEYLTTPVPSQYMGHGQFYIFHWSSSILGRGGGAIYVLCLVQE